MKTGAFSDRGHVARRWETKESGAAAPESAANECRCKRSVIQCSERLRMLQTISLMHM